jgi:hypothetical protein
MNDHIIALRRRATELVEWLSAESSIGNSINNELKTMGLRLVLSLKEIKNAKA